LVAQQAAKTPGPGEMIDERLRFVLHKDKDRIDLGVDEIAQHEINNTETSAKWHRRFAPFASERAEPFPPPTCQDYR
jgi:hypothetical protein